MGLFDTPKSPQPQPGYKDTEDLNAYSNYTPTSTTLTPQSPPTSPTLTPQYRPQYQVQQPQRQFIQQPVQQRQHMQPMTCFQMVQRGFGMGFTIGMASGVIFGTLGGLRGGLRGRELLSQVSRSSVGAGMTFGLFMSIGTAIRC